MAVKGSCYSCGYPISVPAMGAKISCPMCQSVNEAVSAGVSIPTWLFASTIALAVGILAGPAIIATTETGQRWLEKQVRERVR